MKVGNWTILLVISNNCFKYTPKWMVSSLIFQKFSGEGLTEPPPQTPPPPIFLGLRPRFGLRPQFSGALRPRLGLRPRYSSASHPRFGLRPQLSIGDLGLAPPKINSWIRPCLPELLLLDLKFNNIFNDWTKNPYYNLPYNPSAPFVRSRFLVSYRIHSAMKFSQNLLHHKWHTSRVYVIHIKYLSRYFQLTQNRTDKAKWRSSRRLIM